MQFSEFHRFLYQKQQWLEGIIVAFWSEECETDETVLCFIISSQPEDTPFSESILAALVTIEQILPLLELDHRTINANVHFSSRDDECGGANKLCLMIQTGKRKNDNITTERLRSRRGKMGQGADYYVPVKVLKVRESCGKTHFG